jgi:hypothetical protein
MEISNDWNKERLHSAVASSSISPGEDIVTMLI